MPQLPHVIPEPVRLVNLGSAHEEKTDSVTWTQETYYKKVECDLLKVIKVILTLVLRCMNFTNRNQ